MAGNKEAFDPLNAGASVDDFLAYFGESAEDGGGDKDVSDTPPETRAESKTRDGDEADEAGDRDGDILAADGKHIIPNAVLKAERQNRQEAQRVAEQRAQDLAAKDAEIAELKKQLADTLASGKQGEGEEGDDDFTDQDIEDLMADSPVLGKIARKQAKLLQQLETQRANIAAATKATSVADQGQQGQRSEVDDVVDTVPELRYWGNENPEMWQEACKVERELATSPLHKDLHGDMAARFRKVVEIMEAKFGKTELPKAYLPAGQGEKPGKQTAKDRAKEIVDKSERKGVMTLSDLPGGEPPGHDEINLESVDPAQLGTMMQKMTPAQQEAFIARYAR